MVHWLRRPTRRQQARRSSLGGSRLPRMESLEARCVLAGFCDAGDCVSLELLAEFDTFGNQIETVQAVGEGDDALVGFSIYDTGASVITWSAHDQTLFQLTDPQVEGIPVKVPSGAVADAIGGALIGDVSQPGTIRAEGLHVVDFTGALDYAINFENPGRAEGVQSFLGTSNGSSQLPTITGVPIHYPTPEHTSGVAARIDMNAYEYNLGEMFPEFGELFEGLILYAPDIFFVDSGQTLEPSSAGDTTDPFRIPLDLLGEDNHANPGDEITYVENPVQSNVFFADDGAEVADKTLLFDTGAQLSVISTEIALDLGLNLDTPAMTIDVQGAAGSSEIPGYFIDQLQLPIDNDGDGTFDGGLQFTNVPIFVLDLVPGLDGILGMNLFNQADVMLYDPFDPLGPSLQTRFFNNLVRESVTLDSEDTDADLDVDGDGENDITSVDLISQAFPTLAGSVPGGVRSLANLGLGNPVSDAAVVGRHLFFNDSALDGYDPAANAADDNALSGSIVPMFPGQTAREENLTGNVAGITGVMIDVRNLADPAALSAADFELSFGTGENDPASWRAVTPETISVREGAGKSGSDRISLTFNAGELTNGFLQVRLRAGEATGLEYDDLFYFGTQSGDADGDGQVGASDFTNIRANPNNFLNPASADNPLDLNRDGLVNATDLVLVRDHATHLSNQLDEFSAPAANLGAGFAASLRRASVDPQQGTSPANFILPDDDSREAVELTVNDQASPRIEVATAVDVDSIDRVMAALAGRESSSEEQIARRPAVESVEELDVCFAVER